MRLFIPAWDSKNDRRAVKAVEKLTDQIALMAIANKLYMIQKWRY